MSIERVVAILTPAFAALAGLVTSSVGQLIPGVNLNKTDVTVIFVTGATAAAAAALKWLHGRQKFTQSLHSVISTLEPIAGEIQHSPAGPALSEIESVVASHTDQILQAVGSATHLPPSAEQIAAAIVKNAVAAASSPPAAVPPPAV